GMNHQLQVAACGLLCDFFSRRLLDQLDVTRAPYAQSPRRLPQRSDGSLREPVPLRKDVTGAP
ncbi:MAG: hypothetical protein ABI200_05250, partial [Gaiellales bacterium]